MCAAEQKRTSNTVSIAFLVLLVSSHSCKHHNAGTQCSAESDGLGKLLCHAPCVANLINVLCCCVVQAGLIPRMFHRLWQHLEQQLGSPSGEIGDALGSAHNTNAGPGSWNAALEAYEIYNEQLSDLLRSSTAPAKQKLVLKYDGTVHLERVGAATVNTGVQVKTCM